MLTATYPLLAMLSCPDLPCSLPILWLGFNRPAKPFKGLLATSRVVSRIVPRVVPRVVRRAASVIGFLVTTTIARSSA